MCHAQSIVSSERRAHELTGKVETCKLLISLQRSLYIYPQLLPRLQIDSIIWQIIKTMSPTILKAAILIISDTASQNPATDATGNVLRELFSSDGQNQWEVVETKIVPDHIEQIQRAITQWTDEDAPVNLIVTSGGTGFAVKDNTPEVRDGFAWSSLVMKRS
jgi:Probable molybdopterin binding domain